MQPGATKSIRSKDRLQDGGSAGAEKSGANAAGHSAGEKNAEAIHIRRSAVMTKKIRSNLGNVYARKCWAVCWARGRPVRKVPGGYQIMAKRKKRKKSRRKTFKKKTTARRAAKGRPVYKVKGGWRIGRRKRR